MNWVQTPNDEDEKTRGDGEPPQSHDYQENQQEYKQEDESDEEVVDQPRQPQPTQELLIDFMDDPIPPINQTKKTSSSGYGAHGGTSTTKGNTQTSNEGWDSWGTGDGWGDDNWGSSEKKN